MYLKENIKLLRNKMNMSQEKLAQEIGGYSRGTVAKWETGETIPDIYQINQMAKLFGISIDELVNKNLSDVGAEDITKTHKVIFDLFEQFIKGNEIIMDLLDIRVISRALIRKIKDEASRKKGYDAARLYMEAGSLGDMDSYICACSIFRELMEDSYNKDDVENWFMYKDLFDEVESRIMDISEREMEYMLMPYEEKKQKMDIYYMKKYIDEEKELEIIEENKKGINRLRNEYREACEKGDFDTANTIAFYNNKLVDATYSDREDLKLDKFE